MQSQSKQHGGKRVGAGRPKAEQTTMVRVPLGCLDSVKTLIKKYKVTGIPN